MMGVIYRDTITFPSGVPHEFREEIEEYLNGVSSVHGHKSRDSVEFSFESEDDWDACERAYEFSSECAARGILYVADKANIYHEEVTA